VGFRVGIKVAISFGGEGNFIIVESSCQMTVNMDIAKGKSSLTPSLSLIEWGRQLFHGLTNAVPALSTQCSGFESGLGAGFGSFVGFEETASDNVVWLMLKRYIAGERMNGGIQQVKVGLFEQRQPAANAAALRNRQNSTDYVKAINGFNAAQRCDSWV
jgi:hypothetical protein